MDLRTTAISSGAIGVVLLFAFIASLFTVDARDSPLIIEVNKGSSSNTTQTNIFVNTPLTKNATSGNVLLSCPTCLTSSNTISLLCENTLGGTSATISCNFTAKKHIQVFADLRTTTNTIRIGMQFNNDTGTNYSSRSNDSDSGDTLNTSVANCFLSENLLATTSKIGLTEYIDNLSASDRKVGFGFFSSDSNTAQTTAPIRGESACKWANTANQISTITIMVGSGTGVYDTGSTIRVFGYD